MVEADHSLTFNQGLDPVLVVRLAVYALIVVLRR